MKPKKTANTRDSAARRAFEARVNKLLADTNLSTRDLCDAIGISRSTFRACLYGRRAVTPQVRAKLAAAEVRMRPPFTIGERVWVSGQDLGITHRQIMRLSFHPRDAWGDWADFWVVSVSPELLGFEDEPFSDEIDAGLWVEDCHRTELAAHLAQLRYLEDARAEALRSILHCTLAATHKALPA